MKIVVIPKINGHRSTLAAEVVEGLVKLHKEQINAGNYSIDENKNYLTDESMRSISELSIDLHISSVCRCEDKVTIHVCSKEEIGCKNLQT